MEEVKFDLLLGEKQNKTRIHVKEPRNLGETDPIKSPSHS